MADPQANGGTIEVAGAEHARAEKLGCRTEGDDVCRWAPLMEALSDESADAAARPRRRLPPRGIRA